MISNSDGVAVMIGYSCAFVIGAIVLVSFWSIAFLKKYSCAKVILFSCFIIYLTLVLAVTFFPLYFDSSLVFPSPIELTPLKTSWLFLKGFLQGYVSPLYAFSQLFGNVIMTIPFGIMFLFVCPDKVKTFYCSVALLFPLTIEWFQLFLGIVLTTMYRTFDVDDILLNFIGIIIGYGIHRLLPEKIRKFFYCK